MIEANCSPTNGLPVILDIVGTHCRAVDTIKHDGVYVNRHRIPGEDLKSFKSGSFFTISRQLILSVRQLVRKIDQLGRVLLTSCGGTSNDTVRRSTLQQVSMHGSTKKIPGPLGPPFLNLPNLNITALSYSCTTLKHAQILSGNVTTSRTTDPIVANHSINPIGSGSAEIKKKRKMLQHYYKILNRTQNFTLGQPFRKL